MKKYVSLLSFVALFFIGMQFSSAQTAQRQESPEAIAKQKTYELHELVNLSGEQQGAIFKVLVDAEQNLSVLNQKDTSDKFRQEGIKTINMRVAEGYKKILTPEQYAIYEESLIKK
jgi:transcription elongation factor